MMSPPATLRTVRRYLRTRQQEHALSAIFDKYSAFTMIPRREYLLNLQLAAQVRAIPGAVVECGVWRGGMIAGIADVLGGARDYILCDSFEGLPQARQIDGPAALEWQRNVDGPNYHDNCSAPESAARTAMAMSSAQRVRFVAGWFEATLPALQVDGGIALLRLDADWYESTAACLANLYAQVVPGGLVVIDDYYTWDGCARAVHEHLASRGLPARVSQWADTVCYIRQPGQTTACPSDRSVAAGHSGRTPAAPASVS